MCKRSDGAGGDVVVRARRKQTHLINLPLKKAADLNAVALVLCSNVCRNHDGVPVWVVTKLPKQPSIVGEELMK